MQSSARIGVAAVAGLLGLLAVLAGPGSAQAEAAAPVGTTVGDVTGFAADGPVYRLTAGKAEARVSFVSAGTFRIELAPDGKFADPTGDATAGEARITALARYRAAGESRTTAQRLAVGVMPPPPSGAAWASDLVWLKQSNGYGPAERDRSNGESAASDGHTLTLAGKTYEKGIGTHADSDIEVYLGGRCTSFTADVGIDDEINGYGEVAFSVEADGKVLWTSAKLTGASATVPVDVGVEGARHVRLKVTDTNGSKTGDHGDWAGARFTCA